jgi:hypothetical protein
LTSECLKRWTIARAAAAIYVPMYADVVCAIPIIG